MSPSASRVVVLGATGEMGRRVARRIRVLAPGAEVVGACRSGGAGAGATAAAGEPLPLARADIHDGATLAPLLRGAHIAVNAVGPYDWDPEPLLAACIEARCHYVDLAEAPEFLARVEARAARLGAEAAGVGVVPGASTVPGLVEALAARFADEPACARIDAWLSLGSRNPVSPGLLAGLLAPLGRPRPDGRGRWFERTAGFRVAGRRLRFGEYPAPWPDGIPLRARGPAGAAALRRVPVGLRVGFDRAWITRALALAGGGLGRLDPAAVTRVARALAPAVARAAPLGTPRGALAVVARDAEGLEIGRVELTAAREGLDVPALPAAWIAARALAGQGPPPGVHAFAELVSPEEALAGLEAADFSTAVAGPGGERDPGRPPGSQQNGVQSPRGQW